MFLLVLPFRVADFPQKYSFSEAPFVYEEGLARLRKGPMEAACIVGRKVFPSVPFPEWDSCE